MPKQDAGPKYFVDIEGVDTPWDKATITTEEIIELGGWDPGLGVQQINLKSNEAKTLAPGETIELRPGMGFAKKIRWQRG